MAGLSDLSDEELSALIDDSEPVTLQERTSEFLGLDPTLQSRGAILPIGKEADGSVAFAFPQAAIEMAESFLLPGHVAAGGQYSETDVAEMALDVATMGAGRKTRIADPLRKAAKTAAKPMKVATNKAVEAVLPAVDEPTKALARRADDLGIPLAVDQVAPNTTFETALRVSEQLPFSGSKKFAEGQMKAFNKALARTIGQDADDLGPDTIKRFLSETAESYKGIIGDGKFDVGDDIRKGLVNIVGDAKTNIEDSAFKVVKRSVGKFGKELPKGEISSEKLMSVRSDLIKRLPKVAPAARPYVAGIVDVIDDAVKPHISAGAQKKLAKTRRNWRNYKTVEFLLEGSTDGNITPSTMLARVKQSPFIKASRTTTGEDELVDLARIGSQFLPKVGRADLFEKITMAGAAIGAPTALGGEIVAALAGNRALQKKFLKNPNIVKRMIGEAVKSGDQDLARVLTQAQRSGFADATLATYIKSGIANRGGQYGGQEGADLRQMSDEELDAAIEAMETQGLEGSQGNDDNLLPEDYGMRQPIYDLPTAPAESAMPQVAPDIARHEGLRLSAYDDTVGKRTVGYGFNMESGIGKKVWERAGIQSDFDAVKRGEDTISEYEAARLAQESTKIAYEDAGQVYKNLDRMPEHKQAALVNLSYNLGLPNLKKFSSFNAAVNKGQWNEAARQLLKNKKYVNQVGRRAVEIARELTRQG